MISKHISDKEGVYSTTATRRGIDNTPDEEQQINMELLALKVFEPLREWVSGPIRVNSFFRSVKLNKAIGGSKSSQHCKGQAIDIDDTSCHKTNAEMFRFINDELEFDQMIWEFGDDENPNWVHISWVSHRPNRKKLTIAYKENGRTKYKNEEHK